MFTDQSDNRKKQEVTTLAKWLISIPSVTTTKGESIIMNAILQGINDFSYFKNHRENIIVVRHEDQINTSIIAMVSAAQHTANTTIMLCSPDTSGLENYGTLKSYAFRSDELQRKLSTLDIAAEIRAELNDEHVFGLGVYESKAACAAFLVTLKNYSDRPDLLRHNLLFVCTSSTINGNQGIKAALPYLDELSRQFSLKYRLAINIKPCLDQDGHYHVYSKSVGYICPCFYVVGKADQRDPFRNFSAMLLSSKLIEELELNPTLTGNISKYHSFPMLEKLYIKDSRAFPHEALLKFKQYFFNLDPDDLLDILKIRCVEAFHKTAAILDDREAMFCRQHQCNFDPELLDAEVVTYAELTARAARAYQGDLSSAIDTMAHKAQAEGASHEEVLCRILDRLIDLARLARPSIIIFLSDDFIPQQNIFEQIPQERETILHIGRILNKISQDKHYPIIFEEQPYVSQDISFLRPTAADRALAALAAQCPMSANPFYNLHVPIFTLGISGHDMSLPSERVSKDAFVFLIDFIDMLLSREAGLAERSAEHTAPALEHDRADTDELSEENLPQLPDHSHKHVGQHSPEHASDYPDSALNDHLFKRNRDAALREREVREKVSSDR